MCSVIYSVTMKPKAIKISHPDDIEIFEGEQGRITQAVEKVFNRLDKKANKRIREEVNARLVEAFGSDCNIYLTIDRENGGLMTAFYYEFSDDVQIEIPFGQCVPTLFDTHPGHQFSKEHLLGAAEMLEQVAKHIRVFTETGEVPEEIKKRMT
jgi:hypothetical protein